MQRLLEELRIVSTPLAKGKARRLDYLLRTRIERALFLSVSHYLHTICDLEIDGFAYITRNRDAIKSDHRMSAADVVLLEHALQVYNLLRRLSSSDPYEVEDNEDKMGGHEVALRTLGDVIFRFVDRAIATIQSCNNHSIVDESFSGRL